MIGKKASQQSLLHVTRVRKKAAPESQSSEQGFTIVESLVAIIVVGILLVAIAPVLSLSVATRVQSRRVELATQAARSYIDAVRTKRITPPSGATTATTLSAIDAPTSTGTLTCTTNNTTNPTSNFLCTGPTTPTGTSLYCVDFDSDGTCTTSSVADMIVQAFRPNNNDASQGYLLGIRVYRADAFKGSATLLKNTATAKVTQRTFTPGVGQRTAPLVEMTTDISDTVPKYSDLCARISGGCN